MWQGWYPWVSGTVALALLGVLLQSCCTARGHNHSVPAANDRLWPPKTFCGGGGGAGRCTGTRVIGVLHSTRHEQAELQHRRLARARVVQFSLCTPRATDSMTDTHTPAAQNRGSWVVNKTQNNTTLSRTEAVLFPLCSAYLLRLYSSTA